jgi:hypothetical protein
MAGGAKRHCDAAETDAFAITDGLHGAGKIVAVPQPHHVERLLGRQNRTVAGAGVIGVRVGDERALDRTSRIDMEGTWLAAHARRRRD